MKTSAGCFTRRLLVRRAQGFSAFETDIPLEHEPIHSVITNFNFHVTKVSEKNISHVVLPSVVTKNRSIAKKTAMERERERETAMERDVLEL